MKVTGRNVAKHSGKYVIYQNMAITGNECFLKGLLKVSVIYLTQLGVGNSEQL
jgi:hypothetical protein